MSKAPATLNGYLVLHSIDTTVNRFRAYSISITTVEAKDTIYIVRNAWGRVSKLYQSKTHVFRTAQAARQYIHTNLLVRRRHGYILMEQSNHFPEVEALQKMKAHTLSSSDKTTSKPALFDMPLFNPCFADATSKQLCLF